MRKEKGTREKAVGVFHRRKLTRERIVELHTTTQAEEGEGGIPQEKS